MKRHFFEPRGTAGGGDCRSRSHSPQDAGKGSIHASGRPASQIPRSGSRGPSKTRIVPKESQRNGTRMSRFFCEAAWREMCHAVDSEEAR